MDQVRIGNRWRVAIVDTKHNQIAAERRTDSSRVRFDADYFREHVTLGYATTLHAAQGITVGTATTEGACFTVLSENGSRAMAYVGMTRGKDANHAFIYQRTTGEGGHKHLDFTTTRQIHLMRRGKKHEAAQLLRGILSSDTRPRTMHAEAELVSRGLLLEGTQNLLDRNGERRHKRAIGWNRYRSAKLARKAVYERISASRLEADRRNVDRNREITWGGLEL